MNGNSGWKSAKVEIIFQGSYISDFFKLVNFIVNNPIILMSGLVIIVLLSLGKETF